MTEDGEDPIDLAQRREHRFGAGTIQFFRDGKPVSEPVRIDSLTLEPHQPQELEKASNLGTCTFVVEDSAARMAARLAARLRETGHNVVVMAGCSMPKTTRMELDEVVAALTRHTERSQRVEPVIAYERGKQKAQWKRERNRGR